jgi:hypothetical protein
MKVSAAKLSRKLKKKDSKVATITTEVEIMEIGRMM